jgi:hypothetical protein
MQAVDGKYPANSDDAATTSTGQSQQLLQLHARVPVAQRTKITQPATHACAVRAVAVAKA